MSFKPSRDRSANAAEFIKRARIAAAEAFPGATPAQQENLARAALEAWPSDAFALTDGFAFPSAGEFASTFEVAIKASPALAPRAVPTPEAVMKHLVAAQTAALGQDMGPAERLTAFRRAQKMSDDERLASVPHDSPVLKTEAPTATAAAPVAAEKPGRVIDGVTLSAAQSEHFAALDSAHARLSFIRDLRDAGRRAAANAEHLSQRPATGSAEFAALSPAQRIALHRARGG